MDFVQYSDAKAFKNVAWPVLLRHEAENNLILGIVGRLAAQPSTEPPPPAGPPILGTVAQSGVTEAAFMMTPPHKLVLSRCASDVTEHIARTLMSLGITFPGVLGPCDTAASFASAWARLTGLQAQPGMHMRIYQLDRVEPPAPVPGAMEEAEAADMKCLLPWNRAFHEAIHEPINDVEGEVKRRMGRHEIFVWRHKGPVAMAAYCGRTPNGIRINGVYTPPEHRCRGYATALVAALSRRLLHTGHTFCFLYTDLANPTSNSIYQKIGYRPVSDIDAYAFLPVGGGVA